jgi:DNA repair protein SbcC/Rad50
LKIYQDVCGLFAANTSGKSSLLDAITYTIFDKCSKTGKANEVLNNKKTWFRGVFRFEMNGIVYTIERRGTQNKKKETHVKVDVDFYTESENLNGEERSETNKSIRRYLGTYDDFILTAFSLQADNNNFIEKSQKERKDLLSQFLDITVFEQLYQLAADEIKETAGRLKDYKKTDFAEIIIDADLIISENQDTITSLENQEDKAQEDRNDLQNRIVEFIESKLPTTYEGPDIDILTTQENVLTEKIETLQSDIETAEQRIVELKQQNSEQKSIIQSQYNPQEIQENIKIHKKLLQEKETLSLQIKEQQGVIDAKQQKIEHLDAHEYDPNCKYCTSNIFVQDAIEAQDTIDQDRAILTELQFRFNKLETDIETVSIYQVQYDELTYYSQTIRTTTTNIERKELQLQLLESELQTRESELETVLERQESFTKNETAIKHNRRVDVKIGSCKDDIEIHTEAIKSIQSQIKALFGAIEVAKTNRSTALKNLEAYQQLETEYKAYGYYLESVNARWYSI